MAGEPVSRILPAMLKTRNLLIAFLVDRPMTSTSPTTGGFLSHFLSHFSDADGNYARIDAVVHQVVQRSAMVDHVVLLEETFMCRVTRLRDR